MTTRPHYPTGADRVKEHNRRRRESGQVLVTVRVWTKGKKSAVQAREAMRDAGEPYAVPPPVKD